MTVTDDIYTIMFLLGIWAIIFGDDAIDAGLAWIRRRAK